jgi:hypothetical protein
MVVAAVLEMKVLSMASINHIISSLTLPVHEHDQLITASKMIQEALSYNDQYRIEAVVVVSKLLVPIPRSGISAWDGRKTLM